MTSHMVLRFAVGILTCSLSFNAVAQTSEMEPLALIQPSQFTELAPQQLTLKMALRAAESFNPRLQVAQQGYEIRKTDVQLARTGWLPVIEANASYGYIYQDNAFIRAAASNLSGETSSVGVSLRQPLYRGNQVKNAVKRAETTATAAQVQILAEQQQVYLEVAVAYFNIKRDLSILRLNLESLETLEEQLKANEKRYELKDTSLTDVARSKSAVATAKTRIATARANHAASRSVFFRLTGMSGERLSVDETVLNMPVSIEAALSKVLDKNASIESARLTLEASEYAVKEAKGRRLPTIDLSSSVNRARQPENFGLFTDTGTTTAVRAGVSVNVPIFQANQEFGNIKRAKQVRRFREIQLTQAISDVRDNFRITWDRYEAAKLAVSSHDDAVEAAELAAVGTRKIYRSGLISAIDLTETERILLESKVGRERAKADLNVSAYTLLSIIGEISTE